MSTAELKSELLRLIASINDGKTLNSVYTFISKQVNLEKDWWNELSEQQKKEINASIAEAEKEEVMPHEQVMRDVKTKYKIK